jgi:altronate dehydratase
MRNTRDFETARAVLRHIEGFKERLSWHGVTPEGNPSGGNRLRGLYNITLKSLGAVHKKDPRTPVEQVIDYAEPLTVPGFYFMNSPGNDLEGIAGQVASGCNLIVFVTGNGSITNFPFVPTLKITTTTARHQLLQHEMDVNAGRYLDGEPFDALSAEAFELTIATASGARTQGEKAGHSQAQLWRNWRQTAAGHIAEIEARPVPDGQPLPVPAAARHAGEAVARTATERVGLVLPTSMCSSQIARLAAQQLNDSSVGLRHGIDRFVALAHSEGCGFGGGAMYETLQRTFRGYATHPNVAAALLLEHGCEKVPNDAMRREFERRGLSLDGFGWASVQLDGGIDRSIGRVQQWFATRPPAPPAARGLRLGTLTLGIVGAPGVEPAAATAFAWLVTTALADGGTVLMPEGDPLLADAGFRRVVLGDVVPRATLVYGEPVRLAGFHLVRTDTDHWVENVSGLAAGGAHLILGGVGDGPQQGHPLVPVLQVAGPVAGGGGGTIAVEDVDHVVGADGRKELDALRELVLATARRDYVPASRAGGFVDFQLSRGLLGVST